MLRTFQKKQIIDIIETLKVANKQCENMIQNDLLQLAAQCQQAAVSVGTMLENETEGTENIIALLECYCEFLYEMTQGNSLINQIQEAIDKIDSSIKDLPVLYQVVFMPYKAAMWDSMESIWRACKEDERCECLVVPIPYFEYEIVGNQRKANSRYDGDKFPDDVPVLHYDKYEFEKERPDVVYVHNPFDQYNNVTSVHPRYYSSNLRKYASTIVYSPYYVTLGHVSDTYLNLPSNDNVDFILAQSKFSKEYYKAYSCYGKVLPLGSPKLDKVLRLCKEKPQMPEEWKRIIGNKKALMLNTSIGFILLQGEAYINKLKSMFLWFKRRNDIALIWRPHPLLEATLESMRPMLVSKYQELIQFFEEEKIGILDKTSDVSKTVALSDGYIGENGSSVINLFQVAGKPLFILNNMIYEQMPVKDKGRVSIYDLAVIDNECYVNCELGNIYKLDIETGNLGRVTDSSPYLFNQYGPYMATINNNIYRAPMHSSVTSAFDIQENENKKLFEHLDHMPLKLWIAIANREKIYYLSHKAEPIICYDTKSGEIGTYTEIIQKLAGRDYNHSYELIAGGCVFEDMLWLVARYTNRVARLDLKTNCYEIYTVGTEDMSYTAIEVEGDSVWLAEAQTGCIVKCDTSMKVLKTYSMPENWKCWTNTLGLGWAFFRIVSVGNEILAFPNFASSAVKVNKTTGEVRLFMEEFYKQAGNACNGYHPHLVGSTTLVKKINDSLIIAQRAMDKKMAIVDLVSENIRYLYPSVPEEEMEKFSKECDGFEKIFDVGEFARRESWLFSLEGFVDDLVNDRLGDAMERQKEACKTISDNLDGTCGENVHNYIMDVLEKKQKELYS